MIKRFFIGLIKTVIGLAVSLAIIVCAVQYIYNEYAIDSQILIDEYEQIKQEKPVRTPPPTPVPTPVPTPAPDWPQGLDLTTWEYMLVNDDNNIGEYKPPQVKYFDGCKMDLRILEATKELVTDARAGGYSIYLSTGYVDYATLKKAYEKAEPDAARTAETSAPGTNEHQTGLCIDFMASSKSEKDATAAKTPIAGWLERNAARYGFILRYPEGKEEITGVPYSPYHYRYVGVKAAKYIMDKDICFEEFLALYE